MALSGLSEMSACSSAFWGGADIGRRGCLLWSDANDPKRALDPISTHSFVGGEQDRWRDRQVERLRPALTLSDAALR
jgi:hypothetical protein